MWNGTPCSRLPKATPQITGGMAEPRNRSQSHVVRHFVAATLERKSKATGRKMRAISRTSIAQ